MWCGLTAVTDQRIAIRRLRKDINDCLQRIGFVLQWQAYDHVLKEQELEKDALEAVIDYIARNPERTGLVDQN